MRNPGKACFLSNIPVPQLRKPLLGDTVRLLKLMLPFGVIAHGVGDAAELDMGSKMGSVKCRDSFVVNLGEERVSEA